MSLIFTIRANKPSIYFLKQDVLVEEKERQKKLDFQQVRSESTSKEKKEEPKE